MIAFSSLIIILIIIIYSNLSDSVLFQNNLNKINNIKIYKNYNQQQQMVKTNLLINLNKLNQNNNEKIDSNNVNIVRIKRNCDNIQTRMQSRSYHDIKHKDKKIEENELMNDKSKKNKSTNDINEIKNKADQHNLSENVKETNKKNIPDSYIKCIEQLNQLQSNSKSIKESIKRRNDYMEIKKREINHTLIYLNRLNVSIDDLKNLNVIHISGTKGKGSTCAYCESILRSHGYTTGFFSSPHLIEVRERIKINGKPISYDKFTNYFWHVYKNLYEKKSNPDDMPAYFKFLTVMSFYIFIKEKIDVCIMEVGIGGLYDNTNIIPNTGIVGITSLGYDHTASLGNTIEEITTQKAGIMKPNCIAVTSYNQLNNCKQILIDKARETNSLLLEAPNIFNYKWNHFELNENWKNTFQSINISLAIQLAYLFMYRMNKSKELKNMIDHYLKEMNIHIDQNGQIIRNEPVLSTYSNSSSNLLSSSLIVGPNFNIDKKTYDGIKYCEWPGRVQIICRNNYKYYLDGAHTAESISLCSKWFQEKSKQEEMKTNRIENNLKNNEIREMNVNEKNMNDMKNEKYIQEIKTNEEMDNKLKTNEFREMNVNEKNMNVMKNEKYTNEEMDNKLKNNEISRSFNGNKRNMNDITNECLSNQPKTRVKRILIFNLTGERDPKKLLPILMECNFDYILITPNIISSSNSPDIQYGNATVSSNKIKNDLGTQETMNKIKNKTDELKIEKNDPLVKNVHPISDNIDTNHQNSVNAKCSIVSVDSHNLTNTYEDKMNSVNHIVTLAHHLNKRQQCKIVSLNNVLETFEFANQLEPDYEYHVLVTGSLHLVGAVLNVLSNHE